jgi:hypothetical protein
VIGVVENLRAIDSVGVLIFDNSFQWTEIRRLLAARFHTRALSAV